MAKTKSAPPLARAKKPPKKLESDSVRGEEIITQLSIPVAITQIDGTVEVVDLRRLAFADLFRMLDITRPIFRDGMAQIIPSMGFDHAFSSEGMRTALLLGIRSGQQEILSFIAWMLDVDTEALADPMQFPVTSVLPVIKAIVKDHPDVKAFFAEAHMLAELVGGLWESTVSTIFPEFPKTPTNSNGSSTQSNPAMAGQLTNIS